jgi:hypothetical protein
MQAPTIFSSERPTAVHALVYENNILPTLKYGTVLVSISKAVPNITLFAMVMNDCTNGDEGLLLLMILDD